MLDASFGATTVTTVVEAAEDELLRAIVTSAANVAIVTAGPDGRITYWSVGAELLFGWSAVDALGASIDIILPPEDRMQDGTPRAVRQVLEAGRMCAERWHIRKDGSRLWGRSDMAPLRDSRDALLGIVAFVRDGTEQREAEDKHQADAAFLRSVLASSGDCIKVLDLDAKLVFMSEGGQQVMEVSDFNAIRGCLWPDFWQDQGNKDAVAAVAAAKAGRVGHFQGAAETMQGNARWWDVQVTPILDAEGRPEKLLSVSRDITALRDAAGALRYAEGLNTSILNSSSDCIVMLDLDGHTLFVSPGGIAAMEIADVSAILGLSWLRVWLGEDAAAATAAVAKARAGGIGRFQGSCLTHKGQPKWWDVVISPLMGADGTPSRLMSVGRDITVQKQFESELRHMNANLEQRVAAQTADRNRLWQLSTDIMMVAQFDGVITAVNPAWTATLGWTEGELLARNLLDLIHPDEFDRMAAAVGRLSVGELMANFQTRMRHKDDTDRWITWTAVPGDGLINGVGRDVTAEKEYAEILQRTEEQLRQSQKMEAVGQLTGGLAHDFNNLLTGIVGNLELLQSRINQGRANEADRYIGAALSASKRAASLTHRLLAFSRRQTLDPKPTNVNRLIAGMAELVRRTMGPAVEVEVIGAGGLWPTLVDPPQLENALLNLCINARDAMPDGGRLTVETANTWLDMRAAREWDLPAGQYLSMSVTDTGSGMAPEVIKRAFDPFFTTKPLGQGTGLGLSMIYGFARQSGGQVRIYSELGQGSTVCVYLPRYHGTEEAPQEEPTMREAPRATNGQAVLVVDDEPTVRMLVAEVLGELGYLALEAADGAEGLRVLQSGAQIDLLVTDVGLPGGTNGRQLADAGRLLRPGMRVLFITGYAENAVVRNGQLEPGMAILTKPFAMDTLADRITELITAV